MDKQVAKRQLINLLDSAIKKVNEKYSDFESPDFPKFIFIKSS